MTTVGLVALDGTKMAANASKSANRAKDTIDEEVDKTFADAEATDAAEDAQFGDARGDEPPATLRGRADRRRRFKAAKELLDKERTAERKAHERHRRTRPGRRRRRSTRPIPTPRCCRPPRASSKGYAAQAVAHEDQVIVAASVTDEHNDMGQLHPMIEATRTSLAEAGIDDQPGTLLADAGYCSEENLAALDERAPTPPSPRAT
ncbi:MAG TPA: hypothetical protein VKV23_09120 [Acidimicrobiales bacterium]|nr:hypothetical protein [Acidimicrobiales bacterium]